jgi:hypothetical protein
MNIFQEEIFKLKDKKEQDQYEKIKREDQNLLHSLDNEETKEKFKSIIYNIKEGEQKSNIKKFLFEDDSSISQKILSLSHTNPSVYNFILNELKKSIKHDETKAKVNLDQEKDKKLTKIEKKFARRKENFLKKNNMKLEDIEKENKFNINNSLNNFLFKYDRKIPGKASIDPTVKDMEQKKNKAEFIGEMIDKKVRRKIASEIKASEKIGKSREAKRNKSEEFWKNLDNFN